MSLTTALHAMRRAPPRGEPRQRHQPPGWILPGGFLPRDTGDHRPKTVRSRPVYRAAERFRRQTAKLYPGHHDTGASPASHPGAAQHPPKRGHDALCAQKGPGDLRLEGGNAYEWIIRDPRTMQPVELVPVPWQLVQPWMDTEGRVWYNIINPRTGENLTVHGMDMCHFKGATRNGILGQSVLARASEVIAGARAAQDYGRRYIRVRRPAPGRAGNPVRFERHDTGPPPTQSSKSPKRSCCGATGRSTTVDPPTPTALQSSTLASAISP